MLHEIYILDLIGTFAFASYGSYFAIRKDFDLFGIFVCAFLTAVGGGTMREMILNHVPFYFFDMHYIVVIFAAVTFSILLYKKFHRVEKLVLILDSVGLVTFAFIGASKGAAEGLGILAMTCLAAITALGGGVLRDLVLNDIPEIMYRHFYASVAIVLGVLYGVFAPFMDSFLWANVLLAFCFIIRLICIYFKINLWKPRRE